MFARIYSKCINYFAWKNYLDKLPKVIVCGGIIWRVIIRGTITQAPIVRVAILLEAIVWRGQLSWRAIVQGGNYPGCDYPGGNLGDYPGSNCPRTDFDKREKDTLV